MSATQMLKDWLCQNYQYSSYTHFLLDFHFNTPLAHFLLFALIGEKKSWRLFIIS